MAKYYFLLALIMGGVLYYVYSQDPCYMGIRDDFAVQFPDYEILDSGSTEGTPDSVQCHIRYSKPDDDRIYKDIWLYENRGNGWIFSKTLVTEEQQQEQFP
jgi:hypothetical protein